MIGTEQIDVWLFSASENQNLEFKEAKNQFDTSELRKYCVAIANEGGGYLVLGVTDKKPRQVVGSNAFQNIQGITEKLFAWLGFRVDVEEVHHANGRLVVFCVPARPKGTAYHHEGAYFMRSGSDLVPMSEDQLRKIFAEGKPDWLEQVALTNVSAQDVVQLLDTQSFFDLLQLPYPTEQSGVIARLVSERLIVENESGFDILNLAAILLAREISLFPEVSRKRTRVITYSGINKLETESDVLTRKGYAAGFQFLISHIMAKLPQNEVIENALRKEIKLIPEDAIRELVANALIHQDFSTTGSAPTIEVYQNRIEISNPGLPVIPVERFIDGYQSRNERLADLMRRFGICEEKSSGVDRVVSLAELFQLPAPEFITELQRTVVVIYGPKSFKEMDKKARVRACYQHCVLQYVMRAQMTNQTLRKRFGLSESSSNTVSQIISDAIDQRLVKSDPNGPESKRYARYIPYWS